VAVSLHVTWDLENTEDKMVGPRVRVTPWSCTSEWSAVRDLVVSRHPSALSHLMVWSSRVARLPAGVETTVSLLQAHLALPHTPLSIATAVNRFLNHISHLGMALWDVSRLHEAASRLSVPEWVVEVRHETTHGAMPTITVLRAAMQFALTWLDNHYWKEVQERDVEEVEGDKTGSLLELYKYLKVYQLWGTGALLDIKEQGEVWDHLLGLWDEVMLGRDLLRLSVKQAVGLVKTEIVNMLREEEEEGLERLVRILSEGELLIPDKEFLESLEDEEEGRKKTGEVFVPKQLQRLWADFVGLIDRGLGAAALIDCLMQRIAKEGGGEAGLLAGAWVVLLAEGMLGRGSKVISIANSSVAESRLEKWLTEANPVVAQLAGLLCQVAGLEESRRKKVELLVRTAANPPEVRAGEGTVRGLADLMGVDTSAGETSKTDSNSGWERDSKQAWETVPLGGWQGQNWDALWVDGQWDDEEPEQENLPVFHIEPIDWSKANGIKRKGEEKQGVAHFYSDKPTKLNRLSGNMWKSSKSPKRQRRS